MQPHVDNISQIKAKESWLELENNQNSALIDVRTSAEFNFVGFPDLENAAATYHQIPIMEFPHMSFQDDFIENMQKQITDKSKKLYFICRSGARSQRAAVMALEAGYEDASNISDGFEGDNNDAGQRSKINGWKFANLPWRQN
jgi:rhodanese-related sulfurtransferase